MSISSEERRVETESKYRGIRRIAISKSGKMLYERNDTPAKKMWDLLERTVLPGGSRDIVMNRFPGKHIWDTLALAQVCVRPDFNLRQKFDCLKFYFDGGELNNLLATLTRSGQSWITLTFSLAIDLSKGGKGEYAYRDDVWYPEYGYIYTKLDWRTPARLPSPGINFFDTSGKVHYHTHHAYYRTRCRQVKDMKVVVIVRSILESLESNYFKIALSPNFPEVTVDDEESFNWDRYLDDAIEFYNSWGDVLSWHSNCRLYRYHDIKANPPGMIKEIADFWGLDIPLDCIDEALRRTSKKAMAEKIQEAERNTMERVSYRQERGIISKQRKAHILGRLQRELIYDLGYDYSESHEWGKFYD